MEGKVKWFSEAKGYGFITTSDGRDIFCHYGAIVDEPKTLYENEVVSYEIANGPKGPQAMEVRRVPKAATPAEIEAAMEEGVSEDTDFDSRMTLGHLIGDRLQELVTSGEQEQIQVFLCHGHEDKPEVRKLYQRLRSDGFTPWLDAEDLLPGQDWSLEIARAVRESDVVVVCLSKSSVDRAGFVQKEIKDALDVADQKPEGRIFMIPARLDRCSIPDRLARRQWVDLFESDGYERLLRSLQHIAGQR